MNYRISNTNEMKAAPHGNRAADVREQLDVDMSRL